MAGVATLTPSAWRRVAAALLWRTSVPRPALPALDEPPSAALALGAQSSSERARYERVVRTLCGARRCSRRWLRRARRGSRGRGSGAAAVAAPGSSSALLVARCALARRRCRSTSRRTGGGAGTGSREHGYGGSCSAPWLELLGELALARARRRRDRRGSRGGSARAGGSSRGPLSSASPSPTSSSTRACSRRASSRSSDRGARGRDPPLARERRASGGRRSRCGRRSDAHDARRTPRRSASGRRRASSSGTRCSSGRFGGGEVRFVVAHELAHVAREHLWKGVAWFALLALPVLVARSGASTRRARRPAARAARRARAASLLQLALAARSRTRSRGATSARRTGWRCGDARPGRGRGAVPPLPADRPRPTRPAAPGRTCLLDTHPTLVASSWRGRRLASRER